MVWLPNGRALDAQPSRRDDFVLRMALPIAPFAMFDGAACAPASARQ
jgi:hypothetical protein